MDEGKITSASDFDSSPMGLAQRWGTEIEAADQELRKFHDEARRIVQRYLDKRDAYGKDESKVNLFWSTMKVLLSMLYARPPKADVSRTFLDWSWRLSRRPSASWMRTPRATTSTGRTSTGRRPGPGARCAGSAGAST